jgi:hypothetical protein
MPCDGNVRETSHSSGTRGHLTCVKKSTVVEDDINQGNCILLQELVAEPEHLKSWSDRRMSSIPIMWTGKVASPQADHGSLLYKQDRYIHLAWPFRAMAMQRAVLGTCTKRAFHIARSNWPGQGCSPSLNPGCHSFGSPLKDGRMCTVHHCLQKIRARYPVQCNGQKVK